MKIGYSIEKNKFISAEEVTYEQAKLNDIICPCCFENIIKCVRPLSENRSVEYLSHRPSKNEETIKQNKICEERVISMTKEDKDSFTSEKRGQSLVEFMERIEDRICVSFKDLNSWIYLDDTCDDEQKQDKIKEEKHNDFILSVKNLIQNHNIGIHLNKIIPYFDIEVRYTNGKLSYFQDEHFVESITRENSVSYFKSLKLPQPDPEAVNKAITLGNYIFQHLKTEQAKPNLDFLMLMSILSFYLEQKKCEPDKNFAKVSIRSMQENRTDAVSMVMAWTYYAIIQNKPHKAIEYIEELSRCLARQRNISRSEAKEQIEKVIYKNICTTAHGSIMFLPINSIAKNISGKILENDIEYEMIAPKI